MLRELDTPTNPQQGFLGKQEASGKKHLLQEPRVTGYARNFGDCVLQSAGTVFFELPTLPHLFEVSVNDGNWHVGLASQCSLILKSQGLQRAL